ncbi:MAG: lipopolysaccharide heptosyltransferase II [bacterium]
MSRPFSSPSRVLCVAPNWLGDGLFCLPAVDALRRRFPAASFDLLARAGLAGLLGVSGRFQGTHVLDPEDGRGGRLRAQWGMRHEGYGLAVVFPDSFSAGLGAWLTGARERVGRSGEGRSPFLTRRLPKRPARGRVHVVDEYLALAEACGASAVGLERVPTFHAPERGLEERQRIFRELGLGAGLLVGLCPTAAYGPAKQWPLEFWDALALELRERRFSVVLFCAKSERGPLEALARARGLPLLSPSLPGLAACLAACEVVVANDSGSLHLAASLGVRSLGLYGSTNPRWTGPLGPRTEALSLELACSPCYAKVCPLGHLNCLRTLSVERVLESFSEILKR